MATPKVLLGTIAGVFDDGMSSTMNVVIPHYGEHGYVDLMMSELQPTDVRDLVFPIFGALAGTRDGNVSVSIHFSTAIFRGTKHVIILQKFNDEISVYLDGELFQP